MSEASEASGHIRVVVTLWNLADVLAQHGLRVERLEWGDGLPELHCEFQSPPVVNAGKATTRNQPS